MSWAERSKRSAVPAARSGLALRTYLVLLVVSVLVPILVFAGVVFARYYDSELSRIEVGMLDDARRLALTIDQDHRGLMATLQTFAISRLIPSEDYREAYRRASKIRDITGANILVRDANTGSQVLNTRVSFGTPLPTDTVEGDDEVRRTKQPYISGVITGSVARRYVYAITVPVLDEDGQLTHFLHFSIEMQGARRPAAQKPGAGPGRRHLRSQFQIRRTERAAGTIHRRAGAAQLRAGGDAPTKAYGAERTTKER